MAWHPDVPDLPITKPKEIEKLESMDPAVLNSLPDLEVQETVRDISHAVAKKYHEEVGGTYDDCVDVVSTALTVTGSSLGGKVGLAMIASNQSAAKNACRIIYGIKEQNY